MDDNETGFGYIFLTLIMALFCRGLFHDLQSGVFEGTDGLGNHYVYERGENPIAYFWKAGMESLGALFIFVVWVGATVGLVFKGAALFRRKK